MKDPKVFEVLMVEDKEKSESKAVAKMFIASDINKVIRRLDQIQVIHKNMVVVSIATRATVEEILD